MKDDEKEEKGIPWYFDMDAMLLGVVLGAFIYGLIFPSI